MKKDPLFVDIRDDVLFEPILYFFNVNFLKKRLHKLIAAKTALLVSEFFPNPYSYINAVVLSQRPAEEAGMSKCFHGIFILNEETIPV